MPSHNHSLVAYGGDSWYNTYIGGSNGAFEGAATKYTNSTGGGSSHSHSLSGSITSGGSGTSGSAGAHTHTISAPQYIDVIVCIKD
jgi:hypothetical protein